MKRIITFLAFLSFACFISNPVSFGQQISASEAPDYTKLKAEGKLKDYPASIYPSKTARPEEVIHHTSFNANSENRSSEPVTVQSAANCDCWLVRDGTWATVPMTGSPCSGCPGFPPDYRNDDSYTATPVALPFNFCMDGNIRTAAFINDNGSITFGTPFSTYTSSPFPNVIFPEMIAAFFGDVDTRNLASGLVYYQVTATHLVVQWDAVGYYGAHADKLNSFQLIITDGTDPLLTLPHNVGFCYRDMQWTTGDASGGVNGFGGTPATVGVNFGDGVNFIQIGRYDRPGASYLGPQAGVITPPFSGVDWLDNQHFEFNWCPIGDTLNLPPIAVNLAFCDTVTICVGDTAYPSGTFLSPESNQITTIAYATSLSNFTVISNIAANSPTIIAQVIGTPADIGYQTITLTATDDGLPPQVTTLSIVVHVLPSPTAIVSPTNVTCFGGSDGSAIVTASGGTGAYTYTWLPSGGNGITASGLTANTYSVTVSDSASCDVVQTVVITQPPALAAPTGVNNISCFGGTNGSANVAAGGGTPGYTYLWSPSGGTGATASNLAAGTYTITVTDANGCTITSTAIITEPTALTAAASMVTNVSCNGGNNGSATVAANNGSPTYTYLWSPSGGIGATANNLTAGTYTVTVTDSHGCTITSTAVITQPTVLTAAASMVTNVSCNGGNNGSATVVANNGSPAYTYLWSPSGGTGQTASNLAAGTYTITVTDSHGCIITSTAVITQPTVLAAAASMVTNVSCNGGNNGSAAVAANNGSPSYTYLWSPSGGTGQTAINLTAGSYTVTVTDSHGCTITSTAVIAQPTVLAAAASMVADVSCNGGNNGSATVATNNGSPAYTYLWSPSGGTGQTASNLMAGTYTVTVTDSHGCTITSTAVIAQPTVLAAAASMLTNASCNGGNNGSATVVANNGSPAYTYLWAPSGGTGQTASNLTAGTYTVTVTDSHGCTITSTAVITQPTTLMAAASMVTDVSCNGGNDGSVAVAASNGSPAYTYLWSPSGGTGQTASILTAGTYTVTVTDANGCSTTSTAIIAQPTTLAAAASMVTDVSCNGGNNGSAAVAANNGSPAYTYLWSPSGGTGQTANNLIAGTYTVTVTDSHGCTISSTAVIAEPTVLAAAVFMVADVSCNGGNDGSAAVAANNGSPSYTYLWTPSGGTGQTANNLTAGNYTVTVTDSHGCTISSTTVIAEPTALAAAASMVTDVLCNGGNDGSATVAASNGSPAYTYLWSPSGGTGQTANNLIAGTYTVTVTDSHGCSLTSTAVITEPTVVTAIASTVNNVACFSGNDGTAAVNPGGGIPPYRYAWSPSGGNAITASNLVAGTYTVTVTDVNNCSITSIAVIAEPTVLTAFATTLNNIACSSANNGVAAVTPGGGAGTYTYLWSPSGGTGMTASNLGGNTYTVTVTDGNGCSQTSTTTITQSIPVSSNITSTTNVLCNGGNDGQAVVAAAGGSGAGTYTYLWLPSGGSNVTASNLSAGNYTVVVADANGCTVTSTTVINQPTPVTLSVNGAATICIGKATTIAAVPGGGTLPYTYLWNNGSTFASQAVAPLTTTIYTVVVTDANGCTISQSVTITVHPPLNVTANAPPQICNGGSGTVSASAGGGNGGPYTYTWNSGQTTSSFTASPAFTTVYTVTIDDGCSPPVQTTTSIIVNPVPVVSFTPLYAESCVPASVDFTSDSIAGLPGSGYLWNFGDGSTSTNINPTHVYTSAGQYSVTLTITSAQGCINTLTVTNLVTANAIPLADFTAPEQVGINEAVDISFINSSAGSSAWQWDFGDNSGTASVFNPTHTYTDTGVYTIQLIAMSPAGCLDTTYRSIDVIGEFAIFIPNTFTPNGDGVNDMFNAFGVYVRDFDMVILDRWGAKIFHSNSLTNGWDGTYFENGTICQNGVYVYKIMAHDAFGKLHEFVGRVSLVR